MTKKTATRLTLTGKFGEFEREMSEVVLIKNLGETVTVLGDKPYSFLIQPTFGNDEIE